MPPNFFASAQESANLFTQRMTAKKHFSEWLNRVKWGVWERKTFLLIACLGGTFTGLAMLGTHDEIEAIPYANQASTHALLFGLVGGLSGGCGAALLLSLIQLADRSIKTVDEAERILGIAVAATIPHQRNAKPEKGIVALAEPTSTISEEFRRWRVLLSHPASTTGRVLLITSTCPHEGKSFCSINLAGTFARAGEKTLLIDADLRRPTLTHYLPSGSAVTLPDMLTGKTPMDSLLTANCEVLPHLSFLRSGRVDDSPSDLFSSECTPQFLKSLRDEFSWIIIDSPPLTAVSDALILAQYVDEVCFILRRGQSPRVMIKRSLDTLRRIGVIPRALVLNDMPDARNPNTYAYYYATSADWGKRH